MKNYFQFLLLSGIALVSACEKPAPPEVETKTPVFGYLYNGELEDDPAESFQYEDSVIIITTGKLQLAFDGINLLERQLNQASFSEAVVEGNFSSNLSEISSGTLQILAINREDQTISGTFSFEAFDSFNPGHSVSVSNGVFENIPLYPVSRNYYQAKALAQFEQKSIAYRQVYLDYDGAADQLKMELNHPTQNKFSLLLDANIEPGIYDLDDLPPARFQISFSDRIYETDLSCKVACQLNIQSIDPANKQINLNLSGNFQDNSGKEFIIQNLWIK